MTEEAPQTNEVNSSNAENTDSFSEKSEITENQTKDIFDISKLIVPEGFELSDNKKEALSEMLKEGSLQEKVQRLIDFHTTEIANLQRNNEEALQTKLENGFNTIKNDSEYGGFNFEKNLQTANLVFNKCLSLEESEKLTEELLKSGLASNPSLFKIFHKFGKALSEDNFIKSDLIVDTRPKDSDGKAMLSFKN